ncbi:MAG: hypothetical protein JWL92_575 [Candidatus Nomurabacteria bacterium]|nr:hypothetical protein [Candidatus Nomurabacteria bacterium]
MGRLLFFLLVLGLVAVFVTNTKLHGGKPKTEMTSPTKAVISQAFITTTKPLYFFEYVVSVTTFLNKSANLPLGFKVRPTQQRPP